MMMTVMVLPTRQGRLTEQRVDAEIMAMALLWILEVWRNLRHLKV